MNKPMFELAGRICPCFPWLLLTFKVLQIPGPVVIDGLVASVDSDHKPHGVPGMSPGTRMPSELNLPLILLHLIFIYRLLSWFLILCSSSLCDWFYMQNATPTGWGPDYLQVYGEPVSFNEPGYDQGFASGFSRETELLRYIQEHLNRTKTQPSPRICCI